MDVADEAPPVVLDDERNKEQGLSDGGLPPPGSDDGAGAVPVGVEMTATKPVTTFVRTNGVQVPLPALQLSKMARPFRFKLAESNVDVASLDITPNGCYVLIGCSNGMIVLFSTAIPDHEGTLVGHIQAKGLHTNLLLTVKVTDDGRFCFGGVVNGSSEVVGIDLGRLPYHEARSLAGSSSHAGSGSAVKYKGGKATVDADMITIYSHFDAKLRGFATATRIGTAPHIAVGASAAAAAAAASRYRLVCGRGRVLHIWEFVPECTGPRWTCLCDVATNGNTIETIEFRNGGAEMLSKSAGAVLRVWDLRSFETDPTAKPTFDDIPNSVDVKSLMGDFALGGIYNFAVVKVGAPKEANRDAMEIPERSVEDDQGQRRKRMMRQIEDVIATHDARHALVLCTDGGVLYFRNSDEETAQSLMEFSSLTRNRETEKVWTLRRIGHDGDVVLLRAIRAFPRDPSAPQQNAEIAIQVQLLTDAANGEIKSTQVGADAAARGGWNPWGFYHDPTPLPVAGVAVVEPAEEASSAAAAAAAGHGTVFSASRYHLHTRRGVTPSVTSSAGRPPLAPQTGSGKPPLGPSATQKRAPLGAVRQDPNLPRVTPGRRDGGSTQPKAKAPRPAARSASASAAHHHHGGAAEEGEHEGFDYLTPAAALLAAAQGRGTAGPAKAPTISPEDPLDRLASCNTASSSSPRVPLGTGLKRPLPAAVAAAAGSGLHAGVAAVNAVVDEPEEEPPLKRKPLTLGPAPLVHRMTVSNEVRAPAPLASPALELLTKFHAVKTSWVASCRRVENADTIDWQRVGAAALHGTVCGPATANRLAAICREQDRLRTQFITDVCRSLGDHVRVAASALNHPTHDADADVAAARGHALLLHEGHRLISVEQLVAQYSRTAQAQLDRQDFELRGAMVQDAISHRQAPGGLGPRVAFRHKGMFATAVEFDAMVKGLVKTVAAAAAGGGAGMTA